MKRTRKKPIAVGDTFTWRDATFRREPDDPDPLFECERMRVTCIASKMAPGYPPYTFPVEPLWFETRGLTYEP